MREATRPGSRPHRWRGEAGCASVPGSDDDAPYLAAVLVQDHEGPSALRIGQLAAGAHLLHDLERLFNGMVAVLRLDAFLVANGIPRALEVKVISRRQVVLPYRYSRTREPTRSLLRSSQQSRYHARLFRFNLCGRFMARIAF